MSDGFPSHSCADAILSHGEVDEDEDRPPPVRLVSGRGRRTGEVRTRCVRGSRALWTVMREGRSIVVPRPEGERPE